MNDEAALGYARIYCVAERAIERAGGRMTDTDADNLLRFPGRISRLAYEKAAMMNALDDNDEHLVEYYLDRIPPNSTMNAPADARACDSSQQSIIAIARASHDWHNMTPKDAAEVLGVTETRVRALIKAGKLDAIKVGGKWYVTERSVKRRARTMKPTAFGSDD